MISKTIITLIDVQDKNNPNDLINGLQSLCDVQKSPLALFDEHYDIYAFFQPKELHNGCPTCVIVYPTLTINLLPVKYLLSLRLKRFEVRFEVLLNDNLGKK